MWNWYQIVLACSRAPRCCRTASPRTCPYHRRRSRHLQPCSCGRDLGKRLCVPKVTSADNHSVSAKLSRSVCCRFLEERSNGRSGPRTEGTVPNTLPLLATGREQKPAAFLGNRTRWLDQSRCRPWYVTAVQ